MSNESGHPQSGHENGPRTSAPENFQPVNFADQNPAPGGADGDPDTGPVQTPGQIPGQIPGQTPGDGNAPSGWQPRPSGALTPRAWSDSPTGQYQSSPYQAGSQSAGQGAGLGGAGYGTGTYGQAGQGGYPGSYPSGEGTGSFRPGGSGAGAGGASIGGYPGGYDSSGYGSGSPYESSRYPMGDPNSRSMDSTGSAAAVPRGTTATRPRGRRVGGAVGVGLLVVVLSIGGGFLGAGFNHDAVGVADSSLSQQVPSPAVSNSTPAPVGSVEAVASKVLPSVVSILATSPSGQGEGSGVILTTDGRILTNNHVIAGATDLTVQFNDGTSASAKVIGADSTDDLAVIQASGVSGLTKAALGSSAGLKVGQPVVAVGSPLGLSATVTSGIVSALNRPVRTASAQQQQQQQDPNNQSQSTAASPGTVLNAVQTDAAINPGNSGGPLVDMNGAVVGINSAIASLSSSNSSSQAGSIGVGFAIPIDQAQRIAQEIVNTGTASHAVLGASVGDATSNGTANGISIGAKIAAVTAGSGAEKAGLKAGDVVSKISGQSVESADALIAAVRSATPGGTVAITYQRDGKTATATVTLGSAPSK